LVVILMGLKVIEHGTFRFSLKSTFLPSVWADWNAPRFYAAYFFLADFTRAHLALCAAAILRLPAAEIVRLGFGALALPFAHRAFCARLIRLRAKADIVCFALVELLPPFNLPRTERAASTCRSSFTRFDLVAFNTDTKDASPVNFSCCFAPS
jgi:hypothetical protein